MYLHGPFGHGLSLLFAVVLSCGEAPRRVRGGPGRIARGNQTALLLDFYDLFFVVYHLLNRCLSLFLSFF